MAGAAICLAFLSVSIFCAPGCGRFGERMESAQPPLVASPAVPSESAKTAGALGIYQETLSLEVESGEEWLDRARVMRKHGRFDEFVETALSTAAARSDSVAHRLLQSEALLAVGRSEEAEAAAERAAARALDADNPDLSSQALKLWVVARFRQERPIKSAFSESLLARLPADTPGVEMVRFWSDSLGDRAAFRLVLPQSATAEIPAAQTNSGSVSADLNAIQARANGVSMPLAFIDTGAQHTLMTVAAARAASVKLGASNTQLVGFAKLAARAGLLESLELGDLTLENVPVLVGDAPPLLAVRGQMALGTELMHHVRLTLDYPRRRVIADSGGGPAPLVDRQSAWRIPLWTFPQACLAQGQLAPGNMARVLIDTGNRAGTFVSSRWARRSLPSFDRPGSGMIFKFKQRNMTLDELSLGDRFLRDWSVVDTMPRELERLDIVDVLVGHDLLGGYQVTIDLPRRELLLQGDPAARN